MLISEGGQINVLEKTISFYIKYMFINELSTDLREI